MSTLELPAKRFPEICKALGYRKRTVTVTATESVTFRDVNWSGGTRSEYRAFDLATGKVAAPDMSLNAPWENPFEGATVNLPAGVVIARTGVFCGQVSRMTIYVNPANMPALLAE